MNVTDFTDNGVRDEIAQLETRIEQLAEKLENCRKISLAARIGVGAGFAVFAIGLLGIVRFDITVLLISIIGVLGGFVLLGSNSSTANETAEEMAKAEAARAELIGSIRLRVVGGSDTLH
jgi:Flp pilus assembly protein TadB